jgi:site-specific DNA-methyltransferase (adenine-specific)/site-specific DNA-methyltransferase (cytosine-N4-specific)
LGSRLGDTILDPFGGSGTTGIAALELGRKAILIELNPSYVKISKERARNGTQARFEAALT